MNETDTPNNGLINEIFVETLKPTDSPQQEAASCPFYSVFSSEDTAIAKVPLLAPVENPHYENEIPVENASQQDWVAEPQSKQQAIVDSEFKKLLTLNEELSSANNDLYDQVQNLKASLAESQKALQWQKKRSTVTESMLNQQTQELTAASEQIQSQFQQLETAVQTVQRQESLIENYKAQLEISQQRLAQLERECAFIQSNYSEQSHQLVQSENSCRELRTRLMRQQRQTLQFKAALEKCLETTVPSYDSVDDNDPGSTQAKSCRQVSSFIYTQPIRPWSAEAESWTDDDSNPSEESSALPEHQWDNSTANQSSTWDTSSEEVTSTPTQPTNTLEIEVNSPFGSKNLEEQLDGVIQMFFDHRPASTIEDADSTQAAGTVWETSAISLVDELETDNSPEDYWSEGSQSPSLEFPGTTVPQEQFADDTNPNSPSPLVYPQRPPKGRKSLASVELPNFYQNSD